MNFRFVVKTTQRYEKKRIKQIGDNINIAPKSRVVGVEICYLSSSYSIAIAYAVAREMICERSVPQFFRTAKQRSGVAIPIQTVPTGFSAEPPVGPAMPVVEMAKFAPETPKTPFAIAMATCSDTAPYCVISDILTPKTLFFDSLLYDTTPHRKYADAPA